MSGNLMLLSMLHEPAGANSATRNFRRRPVIAWTLDRLATIDRKATRIVCWTDQEQALAEAVSQHEGATTLCAGDRRAVSIIDTIAASRRWADGWRGGIGGTTAFDSGFDPRITLQALNEAMCHAAILINPADGLIDPMLLRSLLDHATSHPDVELCFSQAAPGLSGVLIRRTMIERLAKVNLHPGRLLHYLPDQPSRDPIASDSCAAVPTAVARTLHNFRLDSHRQIHRFETATFSLNGQLIQSDAVQLLDCAGSVPAGLSSPRELRLELTTRRACKPAFAATGHFDFQRPDLSLERLSQLIEQIKDVDDLRVTFAGVGDPLLHPELPEMLKIVTEAGNAGVSIETDLLQASDEILLAIVDNKVDIVAVHLPASQAATYQRVMGVDGLATVIGNVKRLIEHRAARGSSLPLIVPIFTKLAENLGEMEAWYDQWTRILGWAVIESPTDLAGQIPDVSLADMSPPSRVPCRRLSDRMTMLSDGRIASCEEDVLGAQQIGDINQETVETLWQVSVGRLREDHANGEWERHPLCKNCRQWHRP